MATSLSNTESTPDGSLSTDEVVAIAAALLLVRHESRSRYGRILAIESRPEEPVEEKNG